MTANNQIEIWNEAYNIFTDYNRTESQQYNDMQSYLQDCVRQGKITQLDKCYMAKDVMRTAEL